LQGPLRDGRETILRCRRAEALPVEGVDGPVGLDYGSLPSLGVTGRAVLHPDDSLVALLVEVGEYVAEVDFAGRRLVAARIVPHLHVGDFIPGGVEVGNEIALGDLLVIDVVENLARRTVDRPADFVGLGDVGEKLVRVDRAGC